MLINKTIRSRVISEILRNLPLRLDKTEHGVVVKLPRHVIVNTGGNHLQRTLLYHIGVLGNLIGRRFDGIFIWEGDCFDNLLNETADFVTQSFVKAQTFAKVRDYRDRVLQRDFFLRRSRRDLPDELEIIRDLGRVKLLKGSQNFVHLVEKHVEAVRFVRSVHARNLDVVGFVNHMQRDFVLHAFQNLLHGRGRAEVFLLDDGGRHLGNWLRVVELVDATERGSRDCDLDGIFRLLISRFNIKPFRELAFREPRLG